MVEWRFLNLNGLKLVEKILCNFNYEEEWSYGSDWWLRYALKLATFYIGIIYEDGEIEENMAN